MTITCIITDDEPLARRGLETYISRVPFLTLESVCEDAIQLNSYLQQHPVDLLFLDIEMPHLSGIDLLKNLKQAPQVILTTAFENYASEGFELNVLDYLLTPISFDRFLKAANKAADSFARQPVSESLYFFIKTEGRFEKIIFEEIICVEALENYVAIHTKEKKWLTHITLKSMQGQLPAYFMQTHKSWLVNTKKITSVDGASVLCGGKSIPLARQHRDQLMQKIVDGKILRK